MDFSSHRERQVLQHLRAGGWVKEREAPGGEKLIENLLAKGWIEKRGLVANDVSYRITDKASQPRRRRFRFEFG